MVTISSNKGREGTQGGKPTMAYSERLKKRFSKWAAVMTSTSWLWTVRSGRCYTDKRVALIFRTMIRVGNTPVLLRTL